MTEPSEPWSRKEKFTDFLKLITVEPTMILYMMAFMTTTVVEQAFFVYKACTVDHNLNKTVCDNISDEKYSDINKQVQVIKLITPSKPLPITLQRLQSPHSIYGTMLVDTLAKLS